MSPRSPRHRSARDSHRHRGSQTGIGGGPRPVQSTGPQRGLDGREVEIVAPRRWSRDARTRPALAIVAPEGRGTPPTSNRTGAPATCASKAWNSCRTPRATYHASAEQAAHPCNDVSSGSQDRQKCRIKPRRALGQRDHLAGQGVPIVGRPEEKCRNDLKGLPRRLMACRLHLRYRPRPTLLEPDRHVSPHPSSHTGARAARCQLRCRCCRDWFVWRRRCAVRRGRDSR